MKKIILSGLILATMGVIIISCNKEKIETVNENISNRNIDYTLDQIPLLENKQDINQLMLNPNDQDEEKLNKYLYEIGLATKDLIKNEEFNQTIIGMAKKSNNQTAYLLELKTEAPVFYKIINENLAKNNLNLEKIAEDMTHTPLTGNPEYPVTMEVEKYVPAIFIPNLDALDNNKQPLLSPNIETDCSKNSEIEDFIITWYFDKNGNQHEIILGEETSLKTTNPLFLIDHAIPKKTENSIIIIEENNQGERPENNEDRVVIDYFESREIQIKPGYGQENGSSSNKSEFCVSTHLLLYNNGSPYGTPLFSNNYIKIKEIHPSQFGIDQYVPAYHSDNWTPYSEYRVYWNTYERDWNRGYKELINASYWGSSTLYFEDRMRYSGDWYAWIPSTTNIHNTPFNWFGWETSVRFENWKSVYELYRVE